MAHDDSMTVTVRDIPKEQHKALKLYCIEAEVSLNALMLRLIAEFVERATAASKPKK